MTSRLMIFLDFGSCSNLVSFVLFPATDKLQFIFDQIKHFIEAAEEEHVHPITGFLPIGLEEYMDVRQHTSVKAPCPLMRERVSPLSRRLYCFCRHQH